MQSLAISLLTICGIEELPAKAQARVSHVLSIVDPDLPDIEAFSAFDPHHRVILRFNDIIDPRPGMIMPQEKDVADIIAFGEGLVADKDQRVDGHLLVHCHMGVSRSTAAMTTLMAQADPETEEDAIFARLREIRPQAWPNSVMIAMADEALGRKGRLTEALRRHYGIQLKNQPDYGDWISSLGRAREVDMAL
ncbi:protein-tyrosine-phosphatase [Rhizobium rhizosphaerae]|uniref:Protein-tyrosine-phosphatase n=1 Tax=Xaviernesmea rhizosphaerae TaxID=1672749 RepID=A0ABX3PD58_9HYPH|nr:protein-tyrosine-phosphatase [Xaviernesmea rhizosphaerae]OQP85997.1 protein-tyrosine-phosphatase [Xaviernesmea rhizosphaerae]